MTYGLKLNPAKKHQWVMGSGKASRKLGNNAGELNPSGDWSKFDSTKELQAKNGLETMNCTNFGWLLALIALSKMKGYQLFPQNASERYSGIGTGTDYDGNDPWHVIETIATKLGAIHENVLPFSDDINSWDEYYHPKKDTPEFKALVTEGEKVLRAYEIEPEWVIPPGSNFTPAQKQARIRQALKRGPVCASVSAWHKRGKVYVKEGRDNHWVWLIKPNTARDQYSPFIKDLEDNYDHDAAIVVFMRPNASGVLPKDKPLLVKLMLKAVSLMQQLLDKLKPAEPPLEAPISPVEPPLPSKGQILYDHAYACLGKDMSPRENEFGCAESLYFVMKGAGVPNLPATPIYSTAVFEDWLEKHFAEVSTPEPGDVRCSATIGNNVGHVGIEGKHKVMSNNSRTFKWDDHWAKGSWLNYYKTKGLKTRYFRWI